MLKDVSLNSTLLISIYLILSLSFTTPITFAQIYVPEYESTIAYCSSPLIVGNDHRYFVYVSKPERTGDITLDIDGVEIDFLENLYPGAHAQLISNEIKITNNTVFILHSASGGELSLTGNAELAGTKNCGDLVATMFLLQEHVRNRYIEGLDPIGKLIELNEALLDAINATAEQTPDPDIEYDLITVGDYVSRMLELADIGKPVEEKFTKMVVEYEPQLYEYLENVREISAEKAKKFYEGKVFVKARDTARAFDHSYTKMLMDAIKEVRGKGDIDYKALENWRHAKNLRVPLSTISGQYLQDVINTMVRNTNKFYKDYGDPGKWYSFEEILNRYYEGTDTVFRIEESELSSEMRNKIIELRRAHPKYERIHVPEVGEKVAHLIIESDGTTRKIPILANTGAGSFYQNWAKFIAIGEGMTLQEIPSDIFHEINHATLDKWGSLQKMKEFAKRKFFSEGAASKVETDFFARQYYGLKNDAAIKSGMGFDFLKTTVKFVRLRGSASVRVYAGAEGWFNAYASEYGRESFLDLMRYGNLEDIPVLKDYDSRNALLDAIDAEKLTSIEDIIKWRNEYIKKIRGLNKEITSELMRMLEKPELASEDLAKIDALERKVVRLKINIEDVLTAKERVGLEKILTEQYDLLYDFETADPEKRVQILEERGAKIHKYSVEALNRDSFILANELKDLKKIGYEVPAEQKTVIESRLRYIEKVQKEIKQLSKSVDRKVGLETLNKAKNSPLKGKVPKELLKAGEIARRSLAGELAIGTGITMVFALGPKFAKYGEEHDNPFLLHLGHGIEYSGLGLMFLSVGATIANAAGIALPTVLRGLVLTRAGLLAGGVAGAIGIVVVELGWCAIDPFASRCYAYVPPSLALSKTSASRGELIDYTISGFDVENGIPEDQEGKQWIVTYQGGYGAILDTCVVADGKCKGSFTVLTAWMVGDQVSIFARSSDAKYKSDSVTLTIGAANAPDIFISIKTETGKHCYYGGLPRKQWLGEKEIEVKCG
jgi:hypothetical protein